MGLIRKPSKEYWIEQSRGVLSGDKFESWCTYIGDEFDDPYKIESLDGFIAVAKILNTGGTLEKAASVLNKRCVLRVPFSVALSMISRFTDRGTEFNEYISRR